MALKAPIHLCHSFQAFSCDAGCNQKMKRTMRHLLRLLLMALAGMGLLLAHWVTAPKMGAPGGLSWDWFVLGYSGVGITPSFAAFFAILASLGAAIFLGLCIGIAAGKSTDIKSSPGVLIGEVMACGALYFAIVGCSIQWWNQRSVLEALAMASFLICSYGISRILILSIWAATRLRTHFQSSK